MPGGRLICVVGDVCLSRRKNKGEHLGDAAARLDSGALPAARVRQSRAHHLAQDRQRRHSRRKATAAASSASPTSPTASSRTTSSSS
ncbi:MAG: hypothetical protein MZV49_05905 [Rhodopseudomonas palustris]|nr:hypothetical protein [Rhodopseudomonas palustris]